MTKLYGAPGCDETAVNCLKHKQRLTSGKSRLGEQTRTAREDFLLVNTGQNDQNRLVPFATVGNLEKFCKAETIYIDGTFKASPQVVLSALQSTHCI